MKLFMLRWPNGDTSLIGAPTKDEAMLFADLEWADPYDGAEIVELKRIALDFRPEITDGQLGFSVETAFGGSDEFDFPAKAYPLIEQRIMDLEKPDETTQEEMEDLLRMEKKRLGFPRDDDSVPDERSVLEQMMGWAKDSPIKKLYLPVGEEREEQEQKQAERKARYPGKGIPRMCRSRKD